MRAKKITMGLTALALMGAMALPVSAQETQEDSTIIKATIQSDYTLTIPAETAIEFQATSTSLNGKLKVKGNVLPTQEVIVTAQAKAFHNKVQDKDLPYKLIDKRNGSEFTSATWDEDTLRAGLAGEGQGKELPLSVDITKENWDKAEAGNYEGSIVFTARLQNVQSE